MVFFRRRCKKFIPTTAEPSRCFCGRLESEHDNSVEHRPLSPIKPPNRALKFVPPKLLLINPSHDQSEHDFERWNVAKHTTLYPTNAYGIIEFENMLHPAKAHYLRLAYDTNPSQIVHLFAKQWRLQLPNLVRSKSKEKTIINYFDFRLLVFMVVYKILNYNHVFVKY
jgi:hypothetical protein